MRCFAVNINDCDTVIVLAENRSEAHSRALREYREWTGFGWDEIDFRQLRSRRVPGADGETFTEHQLQRAGLVWAECNTCGARIDPGAPTPGTDRHLAYCSQRCMDLAAERMGEKLVYDHAVTVLHCSTEA